MAKCNFKMFGTGGGLVTLDVICVLPINIINEKIYVFLWFWFVILAIVTGLFLIYRACTIFLPALRIRLMRFKYPRSDEMDQRNIDRDVMTDVIQHCDVGDWFLLYQVAKNISPFNLRFLLERYAMRRQLMCSKKLLERCESLMNPPSPTKQQSEVDVESPAKVGVEA